MTGFNKLFWGFLFVLLDFRINNFDIIPDIIGYWMIYSGLKELINWNWHFEEAMKYCFILGFLSITDLIQFSRPLNEVRFEPILVGSLLLGLVITIVDLLMVYHICQGISEVAEKRGFGEFANKALGRWQLYLYSRVASFVMIPITFFSPGLVIMLGVPFLVLFVVVAFMMAFLMREADNYFSSVNM